MAYLALVRHGESEWNAQGRWTGWTDIGLSDKGREEAYQAGEALQDIEFQVVYTSDLSRAKQTYQEMIPILGLENIPVKVSQALRERDYGQLTGRNKWKIEEEYGEEQFVSWRRGWDVPIPGGETLKDVFTRVVPYYQENILEDLKAGKNVLVSAHGNSLRALVKYLENIPDSEIPQLEIPTGQVYLYQFDKEGKIFAKEIRGTTTR